MNDNPILTIAIPTFNRFKNLNYLVNKILPFLDERLHILIVDNCSSDNDYIYFERLAKSSPFISYVRNRANLGGTVNMLRCVELSNGKYTWLLGDDDDIDPTQLAPLIEQLNNEKSLGFHLVPKSRKDPQILIHLFDDIDDFSTNFYDVAACNIMATNIVNTTEAKKYLIDAYRIVHLQHAFSMFFAKFLEQKSSVKILKLPLLEKEQDTDKRWSKFSAHLDAMETTTWLYGRKVIRREYKLRKNQLQHIAFRALFSLKDEGFNGKEIKRLFQLLGVPGFIYSSSLLALYAMSKTMPTSHIIVYCMVIYSYLRHSSDYKKKLAFYLSLEYSENILKDMHERISAPKKGYFKN